ncbi:hypothetical protein GF361_03090 [Candidatus Woesearchaeota archaeon]|nr:hypothetical protein [Candidatus Woesearchaeota archaeon]
MKEEICLVGKVNNLFRRLAFSAAIGISILSGNCGYVDGADEIQYLSETESDAGIKSNLEFYLNDEQGGGVIDEYICVDGKAIFDCYCSELDEFVEVEADAAIRIGDKWYAFYQIAKEKDISYEKQLLNENGFGIGLINKSGMDFLNDSMGRMAYYDGWEGEYTQNVEE